MSLVSIAGGLYLPDTPLNVNGVPSIVGNVAVMDAASERAFVICRAPKAGNIRKIGFRVQTVTAGPTADHDIRVETVDTTTGLNSGSLINANANVAMRLDTTGWKLPTLTADAVVTLNQEIAVGIVAPGANQGNIGLATFGDLPDMRFPYMVIAAGTKSPGAPIFTFEYSDGSYAVSEGIFPYSIINSRTFNSGSTPDTRALRFSVPFVGRLAGCWLWVDPDAAWSVIFYDSDGHTATTLLTVDPDVTTSASAGLFLYKFDSTKSIAANTFYRLAIVPTTVTNIQMYDVDVNAAADLDSLSGGQNFHTSTATAPITQESDWTQVLTNRPFMGLWFDQLDNGAATAMLVHPGMAGGMRG